MNGLDFCFLTTFYPPFHFGGDGIAVRRLAAALGRRGHRVTVVHDVDAYRFLAGGDPPGDPSPPRDEGVEVLPLESGLGRLSPLLTHQVGRPVATGSRIRKILDGRRFDVIHYHNISLIGGPGLLALGDAVKVYTAHEHWLVCPTHVLWRHGREACPARECTRCVLRTGRPPQLWRYTGYLERELAHVDLFLALSEFSREKHRELGFPREMEVLPCFLPERVDSPGAEDRSPHGRPYFLFVGRLERIKGLDDVLPLFEGRGDADLLVAGDGSDGPRLRELARENPRIRFLGRVDSERLDPLYRNAEALIVPSVGFETFGMTIIEALRHGTPVIARRIGPFPEILEASGAGELFETPAGLRNAMEHLRANRTRREAMASAARRTFVERFSERAVVPRYLELLSRVGAGTEGRPTQAERTA